MRIILGAGATHYEGWVSTQKTELNLLSREDFLKRYTPESLDAMLAEHVWEHMDFEEGKIAAKNCYEFLKPGGYLRTAVPDGFFRNEAFINMVKPKGPGPKDHPAYTHKILYNYHLFKEVFESAGFHVELLEYCDEQGDFHYQYWNNADGHIGRSFRYDTRNSLTSLGMVSIILDAKKPLIIR